MTIAFDKFTYNAVSFDPSGNFQFTPVGTPRGIIVEVLQSSDSSGTLTVTYGGVSVPLVTGSPQGNAVSGRGNHSHFLGSSIPTGEQTVSISRSGGSSNMQVCVTSLTAAADMEVVDSGGSSGLAADPVIALNHASRDCFVSIVMSADGQTIGALTNWTLDAAPFGLYGFMHYDIIGSTNVDAGPNLSQEDYTLIAMAVGEVTGSSVTLLQTQNYQGMNRMSGGLRK